MTGTVGGFSSGGGRAGSECFFWLAVALLFRLHSGAVGSYTRADWSFRHSTPKPRSVVVGSDPDRGTAVCQAPDLAGPRKVVTQDYRG